MKLLAINYTVPIEVDSIGTA